MRAIYTIFALLILLNPATGKETKEQELFSVNNPASNIAICNSGITAGTGPDLTTSQQVSNFFGSILSTNEFPARWQCGTWSEFHGWLYILSDVGIWVAYFTIPIVLGFFLIKRKEDLPFKSILVLFIAFILACGLTHLLDAIIFWWPA